MDLIRAILGLAALGFLLGAAWFVFVVIFGMVLTVKEKIVGKPRRRTLHHDDEW